jgi:hypothetical protein
MLNTKDELIGLIYKHGKKVQDISLDMGFSKNTLGTKLRENTLKVSELQNILDKFGHELKIVKKRGS